MSEKKRFWNQGRILELTYLLFLITGVLLGGAINTHYNSSQPLFIGPLLFTIPLFVASYFYYRKILKESTFIWLCIFSFLFFVVMCLCVLLFSDLFDCIYQLDEQFNGAF